MLPELHLGSLSFMHLVMNLPASVSTTHSDVLVLDTQMVKDVRGAGVSYRRRSLLYEYQV